MGDIISGERRASLEDITARAARAAGGLKSLGIGRGDRVAIYLRNDIAYVEANLAVGMLGAYSTPVNWHYTADEARYLFENSGAKAIVIHADLIEPIRAAIPPDVPVLVVPTPPEIASAYGIAAESASAGGNAQDWDAWLARVSAAVSREPESRPAR